MYRMQTNMQKINHIWNILEGPSGIKKNLCLQNTVWWSKTSAPKNARDYKQILRMQYV